MAAIFCWKEYSHSKKAQPKQPAYATTGHRPVIELYPFPRRVSYVNIKGKNLTRHESRFLPHIAKGLNLITNPVHLIEEAELQATGLCWGSRNISPETAAHRTDKVHHSLGVTRLLSQPVPHYYFQPPAQICNAFLGLAYF